MEKLNQTTAALMKERFGHDNVITLATTMDDLPYVRYVNAYYKDSAFYVVTNAFSGKMYQLMKNPNAAIAADWFTARGLGEDLGAFSSEENKELALELKAAFSEWIDNGHSDLTDPGTIILAIRLTSGILFHHGARYEIDFTPEENRRKINE